MLKRFRPTVHPDNRPRKHNSELKDVIVIGGSYVNTFKLDFNYLDYVESEGSGDPEQIVDFSHAKVIYKQGLRTVLEKYPEDFVVDLARCHSYLTVTLTPEETSMFKRNYLNVSVQVVVVNKSGNVLYNIPSKLRVVASLDYEEDTTINSLS